MGLFDFLKKKEELKVEQPSASVRAGQLVAEDVSRGVDVAEVKEAKCDSSLEPGVGLSASFSSTGSKGLILQRCFKCRQKTPMNVLSAKVLVTKKGSKGMLYGHCSVCDAPQTMFCKLAEAEEVIARG